jgi:hypothetical protein
MKNRFLRHSPSLALAVVALIQTACVDQGYGPGPGHVQGHMINALEDLNVANNELSQASHDKGGHRVNAMQLINQAINEVNAGIAVGESHGD